MIFALLFLLPYAILILACTIAFLRFRRGENRRKGVEPFAIVVCSRYDSIEEIKECLRSLSQSLNKDDRVVIVSDGRDDVRVVERVASEIDERIVVVANDGPVGKKFAQRKGVEKFNIRNVVSVDADCKVGPSFLDGVRSALPEDDSAYMLLLPVFMQGSSNLFGRMVEMEFVCLQMVTAGTAIVGCPTMANGAGMAFSRSLYIEHDSHSRYASGDDMFLLQYAVSRGIKVHFIVDSRCVVVTDGPTSVGDYLRQRTRWLSKAGGYEKKGSMAVGLVALAVLMANMVWPVACVMALMGECEWFVGPTIFGIKLILDVMIFVAGRRLWPSEVSIWNAVPLEVLYPVMIMIVGIKSLRKDTTKW